MVEAVAAPEEQQPITESAAPEVPDQVPMKRGIFKLNVLEAYTIEKCDPDVTPCYLLIETVSQRLRTQTTAEGDCTRERTWATEIATVCKFKDEKELRICLIKLPKTTESSDSGHAEVVGHAIIDLDTLSNKEKTERWFSLLEGTWGSEQIGHLRIRTVWKQMDHQNYMDDRIAGP